MRKKGLTRGSYWDAGTTSWSAAVAAMLLLRQLMRNCGLSISLPSHDWRSLRRIERESQAVKAKGKKLRYFFASHSPFLTCSETRQGKSGCSSSTCCPLLPAPLLLHLSLSLASEGKGRRKRGRERREEEAKQEALSLTHTRSRTAHLHPLSLSHPHLITRSSMSASTLCLHFLHLRLSEKREGACLRVLEALSLKSRTTKSCCCC